MSKKKKSTAKTDLLYIMSNQCGWCKKSAPVVEELVKDGAKIITLDVNNPDDQKRANEVKQKYNIQCGTPLFIDAESGNSVCGFREKDVLEKWANGEEIPQPPKPKSPPPPPPQDLTSATSVEVEKWKGEYEKWAKENDHLPNMLPFDQIKQRVEQAQVARKNQQENPQGTPGAPGAPGAPAQPQQVGDYKVEFNSKFYYVVINGTRETVFADIPYITSLKQQYFQRESDGKLTKVVGDGNYNKPTTSKSPVSNTQQPPANIKPQVKKQIEQIKKDQENTKNKTDRKSKKNTKTIKGI
jgi:thiol-disulfide isomerase/thioredoxin